MAITKTKKRNKDGVFLYRVRVSYQDNTGKFKQKEKSVYGLQTAKDTEYLLQKSLESSPSVDSSILFKDLIDEYLNLKRYEVRENSMRTTLNRIENYIIPYLAKYRLNRINTKILNDWKVELEKLDLSHTTKKNAYGELRAIFNYAVKNDYIVSNPLKKVSNFKDLDVKTNEIQVYSFDEFKKYIDAALNFAIKSNYYDFYVFFNIAFFTGFRKGEIHALRWLNLKGDTLSIKTSIQQKIGYIETPPKNKSSIRDIKIPNHLINILLEHKERQKAMLDFSEEKFICGYAKPLADSTLDNKNRLYAQTSNLHRIAIHDFRHTHASILIDKNIAITEIARRLGHSDIKETLNTYAHFFPSQEDKVVDLLNSLDF